MSSIRSNSESQDGSVDRNFSRPNRLPKQSSNDSTDGEVEYRPKFKVSPVYSVSQNMQYRDRNQPSSSSDNTSNFTMKKSTSSIDVTRLNSERPHLARTMSAVGPLKAELLKKNIGSKNGNMVLQLVLPSSDQVDNANYLTRNSIDEILGGTNNRRRSISSQQEAYSTAGTECYVNQAYTNELDEYGRSFVQSPISLASTSDDAKPTSIEDKKRSFRKHLTNILSSMYALFIVTLGLVVYISDILLVNSHLAETFSLYLVIMALMFILYITIDIKMYVNRRNRYNDLLQKNVSEEIEMKESPNGNYQLNIKLPEAAKIRQLEHHYCFSKDRHSANFYLKIGAAGFCVGHLIHSGLLLGYQILFLTSDGEAFFECATVVSLILDILYPVYSFILLYFMFKYSNIIINRHVAVIRFGLMHCISSSLCFWMWTILRETVESLSNHDYEEHSSEAPSTTASLSEVAFFTGESVALPLTSYNKRGATLLKRYLNTSVRQFIGECGNDAGMSTIYRNYSPYLYPFSVEYSILVVGVLFVIWGNIGKCKENEEMSSMRQCDSPETNNDNQESNIVIHADCHSANKGLFGGIVIMVLTVVSVILFLIAVNDARYETEAISINTSTTMLITCLMTITSIFAYRQMTKLDISNHHMSILDDLLLFICIPAFFLNGIVILIPAIENGNPGSIILIILDVTQVIVQTPLIIDGLRRCSNAKQLRKEKPGRELLTFLIVCNVAMWIMQTFEVKSHSLQDHRYDYYGEELWTIIGHCCVPLMMFYRFHSSVCITDIWKYAYEPSTTH